MGIGLNIGLSIGQGIGARGEPGFGQGFDVARIAAAGGRGDAGGLHRLTRCLQVSLVFGVHARGIRRTGIDGLRGGLLNGFEVHGGDDFHFVTDAARRQDDGICAQRLAYLCERCAHVLGDVSLDLHSVTYLLLSSSGRPAYRLPTAVTIRTRRLSGTSFQARTWSPGTLTRKNLASAARNAGGVSNTAGSPPRS